jgi:CheY-like chemotaxis protein
MAGETVLVVDDDPVVAATVAEVLTDEGYAVETARDGADALTHLATKLPQVVLLDLWMPGLDGWAVAAVVHERGLPVRLILMTAAQDAGRWARDLPADGVVPKPFALHQLLDEVARVCAA